MKTPGSLALDSSVIVRHMRTADPAIAATLKAATELYLPLTALGEMRFGLQRVGQGVEDGLERLAITVVEEHGAESPILRAHGSKGIVADVFAQIGGGAHAADLGPLAAWTWVALNAAFIAQPQVNALIFLPGLELLTKGLPSFLVLIEWPGSRHHEPVVLLMEVAHSGAIHRPTNLFESRVFKVQFCARTAHAFY